MKKLFFKALAAVALWFAAMPAMAQMPQVPALPTDTNVVVGKLDNGLTYYIRHKPQRSGRLFHRSESRLGSRRGKPERSRPLPRTHVLQWHRKFPRQQSYRLAGDRWCEIRS